ncbi:MAG TPA: ATP-binding protein [Galbitalea sp.]|jgi:signal transduction histidine kinase|nr:ATP-binding protein [Galbitalea sp.]
MSAATSAVSASERAGFAAGRVYGLLSFALSIAALILLVLNLPAAIEDGPILSGGWLAFSLVAAGAPALASLVLSRRVTGRILHVIWSISAALLLIAYLTAPLGLGSAKLSTSDGLPWLVQLAVLAGCSGALAWPTRYAIGYVVLLQAVIFNLVRFVDEPFPGEAMGEAVGQLFFVAFFTCLAVVLRRAGLLLDRTIVSAVLEAQSLSHEERRRSARQRFEMLVHDRVLAALLSYASGARPEQARVEARVALAAIDRTGSTGPDSVDRSPRDLVWEIQALTTQLDPKIQFRYELASELIIPAVVADALAQATAEALRNSIRHAPSDRPIAREVRLEITDDRLVLAILDGGDGFDTRAVNPARLGIRSGIKGRMLAIHGGQATVSSRIGYGTTVLLRWQRS